MPETPGEGEREDQVLWRLFATLANITSNIRHNVLLEQVEFALYSSLRAARRRSKPMEAHGSASVGARCGGILHECLVEWSRPHVAVGAEEGAETDVISRLQVEELQHCI